MSPYVLVPGGWYGGWVFDPVVERLGAAGHDAYAVTLPGLEPDTSTPTANLDDHIAHVVDLIREHDLHRVTLAGHSYAGLVIAGVADRVAERIARVVHIDAYVPSDGDSCWQLTNELFRRVFARNAGEDGRTVAVPNHLDPRARPHPLASFVQRLRLTGRADRIPRRTLIHLTGWPQTPFTAQYERLRADPRWEVHTLDAPHDVMSHDPVALTRILLD